MPLQSSTPPSAKSLSSHGISNYRFTNLRLTGEVDFSYEMSMGISVKYPELASILRKALNSISEADRNSFYEKWFTMLLDIIEEMHLLQPSSNIQLSRKSPDAFLKHALRVISHGYGFPSVFNTDTVVEEQLRQGKTLEDARAGGCSGCVEVGAFGKEAYILTGYFNLVKTLELTLHENHRPVLPNPV